MRRRWSGGDAGRFRRLVFEFVPGQREVGILEASGHGSQLVQFDTLLRRNELPDVRFHDLRHTYAVLSIAAGVDIYTLSRQMGHSTISMTADRYGHLYQGHSQDLEALDQLLKRSA